MFVWIFHRISGVLLIFLLGFQLFTGFFQASHSDSDWVRTFAGLHKHTALNCVMVFLCVFHALYGIRTILIDLGLKQEKLLFWICTVLGVVLFTIFVIVFVSFVS